MKYRLIAALILASVGLSACSFSLATDLTPPPNYVPPPPPATLGPVFPAEAPDPAAGASIYAEKCAPCHGEQGLGDGPQGAQLGVAVPALGSPEVARAAAPAAWYAIVTQGRIEKFMPPFTSLSDAERWDVVAYALSLSAPAEEIADGRALYEANCADCHGADGTQISRADFSDQQFIASRSADDLYRLTAEGTSADMPGFQDTLSEDELWAVTAYLRSLSVGAAAPAATNTPEPSATSTPLPTATSAEASPTSASESPEPTSEGATTTPEATITLTAKPSPTTKGLGSITGTVSHGSGGELPAGLVATLHGLQHGQVDAPEVIEGEAPIDENGNFRFENVEMPAERLYYVTVEHKDLSFISDTAVVEEDTTSLDLPVTIYDTTTDTSNLSITQAHILFDVAPGASTAQVVEFLIIANNGDKVVVAADDDEPPVRVVLPEEATDVVFEDSSTLDNSSRFVRTETGFGDMSAVPPGDAASQIVYAFDIPFDRRMDFSRTYTLPVTSGSVLVPEGVELSGDGFTPGQTRDLQGVTFGSSLWQNLPAGEALSFRLSGTPSVSEPVTTPSTPSGLLLGLGALGLALLGVGGWFLLRQRNREEKLAFELDEGNSAIQTEDDILDAIIALDDQYRAGNIPEEAYRARREELKARLK